MSPSVAAAAASRADRGPRAWARRRRARRRRPYGADQRRIPSTTLRTARSRRPRRAQRFCSCSRSLLQIVFAAAAAERITRTEGVARGGRLTGAADGRGGRRDDRGRVAALRRRLRTLRILRGLRSLPRRRGAGRGRFGYALTRLLDELVERQVQHVAARLAVDEHLRRVRVDL